MDNQKHQSSVEFRLKSQNGKNLCYGMNACVPLNFASWGPLGDN